MIPTLENKPPQRRGRLRIGWIQESTAEVSSAAGKSPFTNRRAISMLRSDHHFPRDEKYSAAYPSINDGSVPERNPAIVASRRSFESEPSVVADAQAAALVSASGIDAAARTYAVRPLTCCPCSAHRRSRSHSHGRSPTGRSTMPTADQDREPVRPAPGRCRRVSTAPRRREHR